MAEPRPGDDSQRPGSPPTDRVVAVVELLASQHEPSSVASIASRLELNRSTATSILLALERAGWVTRQSDRRYALGPGLIAVADGVQQAFPVSAEISHTLEELARRAGCGVTLAWVGSADMTFLVTVPGGGKMPAGVGAGLRLPVGAPACAEVIAHRDLRARREWLATARPGDRRILKEVLSQLHTTGVAVYGLGESDPHVLDLLGEVVELLAENPQRSSLRRRMFKLFAELATIPYTDEQLASARPLSVGFLAAPVFAEGKASYELQLGPLRAAVSRPERERYIAEIRATADTLSSGAKPLYRKG
jgi:DNA-binding IclR family transcriptional regulator